MPLLIVPKIIPKKALFLGAGIGNHTKELKRLGLEVYSVDSNKDSLSYGVKYGYYDNVNLALCKLQELPVELNGTFAAAFSFLWLIPLNQRELYFKRLHELLEEKAPLVRLVFVGSDFYDRKLMDNVYNSFYKYFKERVSIYDGRYYWKYLGRTKSR